MTASSRGLRLVAAAVAAVSVTGCQYTDLNSMGLPFAKGSGRDAYHVTVEMESVANLVPNSEVKAGQVTVGSVRRIELDDDWHARLTLGIEKGVELPSNVTAEVAQKSLLGAEYVELTAPDDPAPTRLAEGATIPLARTSRYPETEEALAAVSLLLNGGGLPQIKVIARELNEMLDGREDEIRGFIKELGTFTGTLAEQREGIIQALENLDRLAGRYADGDDEIKTALDDIPDGVDALADERENLTRLLVSMGHLGTQVDALQKESGEDLRADLRHLSKTLDGIADAGPKDFQGALGSLTYPFPQKAALAGIRGDYMNLFFTVDLSLKSLERDYLTGTPLSGMYSALLGLIPGSAAQPAANPMLSPLDGLAKPGAGSAKAKPAPGPAGASGPAPTSPTVVVPVPEATAPANPVKRLVDSLLGGGSR